MRAAAQGGQWARGAARRQLQRQARSRDHEGLVGGHGGAWGGLGVTSTLQGPSRAEESSRGLGEGREGPGRGQGRGGARVGMALARATPGSARSTKARQRSRSRKEARNCERITRKSITNANNGQRSRRPGPYARRRSNRRAEATSASRARMPDLRSVPIDRQPPRRRSVAFGTSVGWVILR